MATSCGRSDPDGLAKYVDQTGIRGRGKKWAARARGVQVWSGESRLAAMLEYDEARLAGKPPKGNATKLNFLTAPWATTLHPGALAS